MFQLTFERRETKYLLTDEQFERLRILMHRHMVPDEWGPSTVCNVYCDTSTNLLVRRSLERPIYKEKVRLRSYGVNAPDAPVFLELKKKSSGIVYKRRCTLRPDDAYALLSGNGHPTTQIERELDFTCRRYGGLRPSVFVAYDREAFYAKDDDTFRMTFDRRVRYRCHDLRLDAHDGGTQYLEDGLVLLETKSAGALPLWLVEFLSGEGLYKISFSKVGMAYRRELERRGACASVSRAARLSQSTYGSVSANVALA